MTAAQLFDIDPAGWARLRQLLDEAMALAPAARHQWLDALPPEDATLRPRLQRLLEHAEDSADPAGTATGGRFASLPHLTPADESPVSSPPDAGPYRATRLLGEGGMGRVWLAERTDLLQGRPVALKLPHAAWRHPKLAERMAQEREILAVLDHPNIARIYDAGVGADGQPWLALEYVEGERIDAHMRRQGLGTRARVELFLQVMRAVAHAARLVAHRDLKPGNILVTADGQARLLDFGIAKLLAAGDTAAAELTAPAQRALTPQYAAPEQILGQPIGTAADIYSLGRGALRAAHRRAALPAEARHGSRDGRNHRQRRAASPQHPNSGSARAAPAAGRPRYRAAQGTQERPCRALRHRAGLRRRPGPLAGRPPRQCAARQRVVRRPQVRAAQSGRGGAGRGFRAVARWRAGCGLVAGRRSPRSGGQGGRHHRFSGRPVRGQ